MFAHPMAIPVHSVPRAALLRISSPLVSSESIILHVMSCKKNQLLAHQFEVVVYNYTYSMGSDNLFTLIIFIAVTN